MAKNSYDDWDTTAGNNTDIGGISIAENCAAANINNAIRELMAQLKSLDIASLADTPGRLLNIQTFTSSGTYTPSSGVGKAHIKMVGAGGGGGGADSDTAGEYGYGTGGGAGGYVEGYFDVSGDGYNATITIGAGGTGGTAAGNVDVDGGNGGDTVYNDGTVTWTAGGGSGGITTSDRDLDVYGEGATAGPAGGTATASGALIAVQGAPGEGASGDSGSTSRAQGGNGGSTVFGGGGRGKAIEDNAAQTTATSISGGDGSGYGSGGGGSASLGATTNAVGGAGAPGFVIIYEYA